MTTEIFRLDPGSAEAREHGCVCDPNQSSPFRCEKTCPVHGLAELKAYLNNTDEEIATP